MHRIKLDPQRLVREKSATRLGIADYKTGKWTEFQSTNEQLEYEIGRQIAAQEGRPIDDYSLTVVVD